MDQPQLHRQPAGTSLHTATRNNRPIRIEMIVHGLIAAGMEMVVARLTRGLRSRGHEVGITCIQFVGPLGQRLRAEGIRVSLVESPGIYSLVRPAPLRDWLRQVAPDVVHVHSGAWLKAARGAHMARVQRTIYTLHGLEGNEPWWDPLACAFAARHTDAIAVVSEPLRDRMRRARIPPNRIHFVPNGIDTSIFHPAADPHPFRAQLGVPPDRLVIGHVARFAQVKNHAFLIDAFARVVRLVPAAHLILAGDGPLRSAIGERVAATGLTDHVTFTGHVEDPTLLYRAFDVFVLPSIAEGTSMSILEAMASALPVVASAVGGTPDLLDHGRAGALYTPGDADAFVDAVRGLLVDAGARASLGTRARERVVEHYSDVGMIERYEALYGVRTGHGGRFGG